MKRILEACCTDAAQARKALKNGASRIELCEQLEVGGVTPSEENIRRCRAVGIPVNVLIRPRGGDFVYNDIEIAQMVDSVCMCRRLYVNGVVVGALLPDGNVDIETMRRLIDAARGNTGLIYLPGRMADPLPPVRELTFHRAFDRCSDPFRALEDIISLGFDRILTSGLKPTAPEGLELLSELVRRADGRIIIMPGSGVNRDNLDSVAAATGATEFHGTRIV